MTGQRIGYIRVSTFDQNPERQLEGVKVDRAFSDKASGKGCQASATGSADKLRRHCCKLAMRQPLSYSKDFTRISPGITIIKC